MLLPGELDRYERELDAAQAEEDAKEAACEELYQDIQNGDRIALRQLRDTVPETMFHMMRLEVSAQLKNRKHDPIAYERIGKAFSEWVTEQLVQEKYWEEGLA